MDEGCRSCRNSAGCATQLLSADSAGRMRSPDHLLPKTINNCLGLLTPTAAEPAEHLTMEKRGFLITREPAENRK